MRNTIDNKPQASSNNDALFAACLAGPVVANFCAAVNTYKGDVWNSVTTAFADFGTWTQKTGQSMIDASQTAWANQSTAIAVGTVVGGLAIFSVLNAPKKEQAKATLIKTCTNVALSILAAGSMSLAMVATWGPE